MLRRDSAARAIPSLAIPLRRALRTGGYTVVPDDFGRAAASDQWHGVWRPPAQHVVASHPTVLLAYQQYRRLVEAVASSPRHPDSKRREQNYYRSYDQAPQRNTSQGRNERAHVRTKDERECLRTNVALFKDSEPRCGPSRPTSVGPNQ